MDSGEVLRGVRVDPPKRFCTTFLGVSYLLRGSNPPDPPSNTAMVMGPFTTLRPLPRLRVAIH